MSSLYYFPPNNMLNFVFKLNIMKSYFLVYILMLFIFRGQAQHYDKLDALKGANVKTYFSKGHQERAKVITTRVGKVMDFYKELIGFNPSVTIFLLSKTDWSNYTDFPVYGMPHYKSDTILVIAAEDNEFWRGSLSVNDLPDNVRIQVQKVYSMPDGTVSMQGFFDLLAIHELGHAFHYQGNLQVQRKWMGELFSNILLHTYIAEKEPDQLPALTLFPKIVVSGGTKNYKYTGLQQLEARYDEIAQQYPQNYGWYQCRWHFAAATIYDTDGKTVFQRLWNTLKTEQTKLDDSMLTGLLKSRVGNSVANVLLRWEEDMVR